MGAGLYTKDGHGTTWPPPRAWLDGTSAPPPHVALQVLDGDRVWGRFAWPGITAAVRVPVDARGRTTTVDFQPEPSPSEYAAFHRHPLRTHEGDDLDAGLVTMEHHLGEVTDAARAPIIGRCYDDHDGAYFAGVLRPNVPARVVDQLRAVIGGLSGKWHRVDPSSWRVTAGPSGVRDLTALAATATPAMCPPGVCCDCGRRRVPTRAA